MSNQSGYIRTINWSVEKGDIKDATPTCAECNSSLEHVLSFRLSKRIICQACGCEIDPMELELSKLTSNTPEIRVLREFEH